MKGEREKEQVVENTKRLGKWKSVRTTKDRRAEKAGEEKRSSGIDKKSRGARALAGIFLHLHAIFELFRANGGEEWIYDSIKRVCPAIFRLVPQNDSTIASRMALEKPLGVVFARGA